MSSEQAESSHVRTVATAPFSDQRPGTLVIGGARVVFLKSGTGTSGATLRIYLERYEPPAGRLDLDPQDALSELIALGAGISDLERLTDRARPDVIT